MTVMNGSCRKFIAIAMLTGAIGCQPSGGDKQPPTEPANPGDVTGLVQVDSISFVESDSLYIGRAGGILPYARGTYISDSFGDRILEFDRQGNFVRALAHGGSGPGELAGPGALALVGDSVLVVDDAARHQLVAFRSNDGSLIASARHAGTTAAMTASNGGVIFGVMSKSRGTSGARWSPIGGDTVAYFGLVPPEYDAELMHEFYGYSVVERTEDGFVLGFAGHPDLFLVNESGALISKIALPAVRRRGVPRDLPVRLPKLRTNEEIASLVSTVALVKRMEDGGLAVVHYDVDFENDQIMASVYLSILNADLTATCADLPLNATRDVRPYVAFRGDTLVTFEQRVIDQARSVSYSRAFVVDPESCDWTPVTR